MWYRKELKDRAKNCLRIYCLAAIAVVLTASLLGAEGGAGIYGRQVEFQRSRIVLNDRGAGPSIWFFLLMHALPGMEALVYAGAVLFGIFVGNPVMTGSSRFFMESRALGRSAGVGRVFYAFGSGHYTNVVKVMFMRNLFICLWGLLLVIPGIVKYYQYYMVPYILSENPDMDYREALDRSRSMMDGNKWEVFILEWSFIGWNLLVILGIMITGMVTVLVLPYDLSYGVTLLAGGCGMILVQAYIRAVFAELYAVLRRYEGGRGLRGFCKTDRVEGHYDRS